LKLKQYSKWKPCYYCGSPPPSTQEHAPCKLMFAAFDCDSITVPSCTKHNTEKSDKDRAVVTVLIKSLTRALENGLSPSELPAESVKAIRFLEPNFNQANREVFDRSLLNDPELDFEIPAVNVSVFDWMRQLSAALVWSVVGDFDPSINWSQAFVWNSLYLQPTAPMSVFDAGLKVLTNQLTENQILGCAWEPGWSSRPRSNPPEVFRFRVCFSPPFEQIKGREVALHFQFYYCLNWYAWFTPSLETREILKRAVGMRGGS
jgi:hypothetical protein